MPAVARFELPVAGLWGFSHCGGLDSLYPWSGLGRAERINRLTGDLVAAGADSFRPHIHWHRVEPVLSARLKGPQDVTEGLVASYAAGDMAVSWEEYDRMFDALACTGIVTHAVLGAGYDFELPISTSGERCVRATPDRIGRDRYLGQLYLHARAAVRRYRGRVPIWQLENELNVSGETMLLARWRSGGSWFDRGFKDSLIRLLAEAVALEDPTALTSHNFHTDLKVVKGLYHWVDDVVRWRERLDIVGIDSFPNYLFGRPPGGASVGRRVAEAVEVSGGRPVMVLESGHAARPAFRGMNEARQAAFVRDAVRSASHAGAAGFYYYCIASPEGYPVSGPWSDRGFQGVEPWWGLVRQDDSRRPGFFEFHEAAAQARARAMNGQTAERLWRSARMESR